MRPDPERDVMVYLVAMVDALSGVSIGDRWTVWAGMESEGSFEDESEAIALAMELAHDTGRLAWLVKDGGAPVRL